jgi:hypothetical protein
MQPVSRRFAPLALVVGFAASAEAQYSSNFEALTASAAGSVLTGQDAYYIPPATTSVDFNVHTYAGNTLNVPANPTGGAQFIGGNGPGAGIFARAQRDMPFGSGVWTAGFDICAGFLGALPTAQNVGSFSLQPFPGGQSFIALATWVDVNVATTWNANYVYFDSAGTQVQEVVSPPEFQNLPVGTWFRWETDFDLVTNAMVEARLTNLSTGITAVHSIVSRFMFGGTAGSTPPTGFRFFAGGGLAGNVLAIDNAQLGPAGPATLGTRYCSPGVPNSTGNSTRIDATGSNLVAMNDVTLATSDMPNNAFGFFLTSLTQGMVAQPGGSLGVLCLSGSIGRYVGPGQIQNSGLAGGFQYMIDLNVHPTPTGIIQVQAGQTWNFQCWHRDSVGGAAVSNFSDALSIAFQ